MTSVLPYLIFAAICVAYGILRTRKPHTDKVLPANAGSISEPHDVPADGIITDKESSVIRLPNGMYANTRSYYRIHIIGGCMTTIGIRRDEEWLASKLKKRKKITEQIAKGDVLLIYLVDKNIYKIRRFDSVDDNGKLRTYYYNEDGSVHESSKPHAPESVMGVVRYKVA